ncbi:MAG: branched-chain amino acid ABC transporter permease [Thermodesulfobacteriota bacterium]|nr:branched-chain amino acid ABC transporter permease [Thermodesulfobacteriota bacterium]
MSILSEIPQLMVYGVVEGSIITLGAIGLSLTYSILKFANFAHGDMMALGAFFCLTSLAVLRFLGLEDSPFDPLSFGFNMVAALIIAMALAAATAMILDRFLYRRFRRAGPIILLISSIGSAFILRNVIQFIWGPQPQYYFKAIQISQKVPGLGVRIKPDEFFIVGIAGVLVIFLHFFLTRTKTGKAMRATADNMDLAKVSGIDTERIILWTWAIGTALAAAGGVLAGIENKFITPQLGWHMLLSIFAAVILGGIGNPYGAMAGGMIIALSGEISTAFLSTAYKPAVAFIIMVAVLIVRPTGLFGNK